LGEEIISVNIQSDEGWRLIDQTSADPFFITWEGDFYCGYATAQGLVFTKYTLQFNNPPIRVINTITHMPYIGSLPASIEFDATGCSDPDPGDSITYEWDFDGDGIFSEPVDDA
jgi:hypothetical protein